MAKKHTSALILVFGLLIGAGVAVPANAADKNEVFTDIKKLADQVGKKSWDELARDGEVLGKRHHDLLDVMTAFKPRDSKTPGIGVDGTMIGIEAKVILLSKRPLTQAALQKEQADLVRMTEITAAVAAVATHLGPDLRPRNAARRKDWLRSSKDMYDASQLLFAALKDSKPVEVKNAAFRLNASCIECHAVMRSELQARIKKLANQVGKKNWDELKKEGEETAHYHLGDVQGAFNDRNARNRPGIGTGSRIDAVIGDGIEARISLLALMPITPKELAGEQNDLIRMAEITAAIAAISSHQYPATMPGNRAKEKDWAKWSQGMHDSALELITAVKERNVVDFKDAAVKMKKTCLDCHAACR